MTSIRLRAPRPWRTFAVVTAIPLLVAATGTISVADVEPRKEAMPAISGSGPLGAPAGAEGAIACVENPAGSACTTVFDRTASASAGDASVAFETRAFVETPRGPHVELLALEGIDAIARVHQLGGVAATTRDGTRLWTRTSSGLFEDWGRSSFANIVASTGAAWSGAVGASLDVNEDGIDDVGVFHNGLVADPDAGLAGVSFISFLDGADGRMLWHVELKGSVSHMALEGDVLVVARGLLGAADEDGVTNDLRAYRFEFDADREVVVGTLASRYPAGEEWFPWWGLVPTGTGKVAAVWNARGTVLDTPAATVDGQRLTIVAVDVATGTEAWRVERTSPSPFVVGPNLQVDPLRNEVVFTEMAGAGSAIFAISVADGTVREGATRRSPGRLAIGDATGDGRPEWILGETTVGPYGYATTTSVAALDPDTGAILWERPIVDDPLLRHSVFELTTTGDSVLVVTMEDVGYTQPTASQLLALDGATGAPIWSIDDEDAAAPGSLLIDAHEDRPATYAFTTHQELRAYDLATGETLLDVPTLSDVYAARGLDADGDGTKDLIVGGESGALFALDGATLDREEPDILWTARLRGPVHAVEIGDAAGDGVPEVFAAAEESVAVVDARSGDVLVETHDVDGYAWTIALADLDGDGGDDIVVPTTTLAAYDGTSGTRLWTRSVDAPPLAEAYFSDAAVAPGPTVVAQYTVEWEASRTVTPIVGPAASAAEEPLPAGVMGVAGDGSVRWRHELLPGQDAALWNSVAHIPGWPEAEGHAVAISRYLVGNWEQRATEVLDARTGLPLAPAVMHPYGPHMGTKALDRESVLDFQWFSLNRVDATGSSAVPTGGILFEASPADLGPLGEHVVAAAGDGWLYSIPRDGFEESPGMAIQGAVNSNGGLVVMDLDDDGTDEVVTFDADIEALDTVLRQEGSNVRSWDVLWHGIAVLTPDLGS